MSKYGELMDKIELSAEARERVLSGVAEVERPPRRVIRLANARRYLALAACLALLIVGLLALPRPNNDFSAPVSPPTEVSTLDELRRAVGFEVKAPQTLPFEIESTGYASLGDTAELTFEGDGETAVFRMSRGAEDNSGDYTDYAVKATFALNGATVTLKGDAEDEYVLALWSDGEYAYSLSLTQPASADALLAAIESVR